MATQKTAEAGDNLKAENERKALHFHHVRKIMALDDEIATLKADRKSASKTAQADGIVMGDIDFTMKAIAAEDKGTISNTYVRQGEILEWLGLIPSFEPDMFRDRMPAVERREKQGELAGLSNKPRESGFANGSDDDLTWLRGYDRGQVMFKDNIESALEQAEAKRQSGKTELIKGKRGRPPKNKTAAAGQQVEGDTPDSVKQAAAPAEQTATPPKPPKPAKDAAPEKDEAEMTNAEKETLRQGRQMFN